MKYIAETAALVAAISATGAQAAPAQNNKLFNNPSFGILPWGGNPAYYADPKDFVGRTGSTKRDVSPQGFVEAQVWTPEFRAWLREQRANKQSTSSQKRRGVLPLDPPGVYDEPANWQIPKGVHARDAFIDNMPKVIPDTRPIEVRLKEYKKLYPNLYPSEEKRDAFIDNQPKVIPHPGGIEAAIEEARRLYPEIYQRDAQGFGLEDFLGLPDTSVNPNFGSTGAFGKRSAEAFVDNMPKVISGPNDWADARRLYPEIFQRDAFVDTMPKVVHDPNFNLQEYLRNRRVRAKPLQQREANAFFDNQPKVVYDKNFKDIVYNNRSPFQLQQRDAAADPFLGDIMKLVGMVIDKTTKRDAVADPFLADIAKLGGMIIDKVTKRDAVADPFFADIVKLGGMIIDKTTKRDAAADPFLGDIMKLVGMVIDKTT